MTPYLTPAAGERPPAGLNLFCLPCAGGGASAYERWQEHLDAHGAGVRVLPVRLPGREGRAHEPRFTRLDDLVAALDEHLDEALSRPHVLYGHSMGAFVAHALTLARQRRGAAPPRALVLSSHRAPHVRPTRILDPDADEETLAGGVGAAEGRGQLAGGTDGHGRQAGEQGGGAVADPGRAGEVVRVVAGEEQPLAGGAHAVCVVVEHHERDGQPVFDGGVHLHAVHEERAVARDDTGAAAGGERGADPGAELWPSWPA